MKIPLSLGPSYLRETLNDVQRCINWYPERIGEDEYCLMSTHGMSLFATVGNNAACRGAYVASNGRVFSAHGNKLYELIALSTVTERGTLGGSTTFADMTDDGTYLIVADSGTAGYTLRFSDNAFAAISDANYPDAAGTLAVQDRRAIVALGNLFYLSELADPTDWTPVRSATAEYSGDNVKAIRSIGGKLYILGDRSLEIWYNTGNSSFTYERVTGAVFDVGCIDTKTAAAYGGSLYWLSAVGGGSVWRCGNDGIQRISTPYIEKLISTCDIGNATAFGFCYKKGGHEFYQLTPSTGFGFTFVYDIGEQCWFQKASSISGSQSYHRARFILNAFETSADGPDQPFAFDAVNGKIYICKDSDNTEDTVAITRTRDFGPVEAGANRIMHSKLRFDFEMDYDSSATPTFTPTLTKTDDAGKSFSSVDMASRALTSATTAQRVQMDARRLGSSRERVYRLVTTEAARMILKLAELDAEMGAH